MDYFVLCGEEKHGPYDSYEEAYFFATTNIGFEGWVIYEE